MLSADDADHSLPTAAQPYVNQYIFSNRVINRWNQLLDRRVVAAFSINAFKGWLNKTTETRMGFFMD